MSGGFATRTRPRGQLLVPPVGLGPATRLSARDWGRAAAAGMSLWWLGPTQLVRWGAALRAVAGRQRVPLTVLISLPVVPACAWMAWLRAARCRLGVARFAGLVLPAGASGPSERLLDAALTAREAGLAGSVMVAAAADAPFAALAGDPCVDALIVDGAGASALAPHLGSQRLGVFLRARGYGDWASRCRRELSRGFVDAVLADPRSAGELAQVVAARRMPLRALP